MADHVHTRTVSEIIYPCILTIILCASYCIRPNRSAPNASTTLICLRKLNVAFWAIVFPELLMFWAYKQWYHARHFASKYKDRGWTVSHGQFVIMGGFILYHNHNPVQVLSTDTFTKLWDAGCIDFPSISQRDIQTQSRAHPLLAALTLLQATWFIIQCIARGIQGLQITQLEAITIVLIGIHALLLPAWWHKPLDGRGFVRIHTRPLPSSSPDPLKILQEDVLTNVLLVQRDFARQNDLEERNHFDALWNLQIPVQRNHHGFTTAFSSPKLTAFASKLLTDYEQLYTSLGTKISRGAMEVPVFHAPYSYERHLLMKIIFGFVFASPYLAMWACEFPSAYDENLWRLVSIISFSFSALITICCFLFCLMAILLLDCASCLPQSWTRVLEVIMLLLLGPGGLSAILVVLVVTGSRIALIVEAFICLNSLGTTAWLAVPWTNLIPHIA